MKRPIVVLAVAYSIGILCEESVHAHWSIAAIFLVLGAACHYFLRKRLNAFFTASVIFFSLGAMAIIPDLHPQPLPDHYFDAAPAVFEGTISEAPERRSGSYRVRISERGEKRRSILLTVPLKNRYSIAPFRGEAEGRVNAQPLQGEAREDGYSPFKYGDLIKASLRLRRPTNYGNPAEFDYERFLRFKGITALAAVRSPDDIAVIGKGGHSVWRWIERVREGVGRAIDEAYAGDISDVVDENRAVMRALILGEQGWLTRDVRAQFTKTGTVHILVVSGLHLAMIAWSSYRLFLWIMKRSESLLMMGLAQKIAACVSLVPVTLYTVLAGANIPLLRAYVMVLVFVLSFLTGRSREIYSTLALAALVILVVEPQALFSISFQLSFASVLSIVYLSPRLDQLLGWGDTGVFAENSELHVRFLRWTGAMVLTSLSAGLGLSPLLALYFNQVSLWGLVANIVVIPTLGFLCVSLGLLGGFLSFVSPALSLWLFTASKPFLWVGLKSVGTIGSFPLSSVRVTTPTLFEIFLMYGLIIVLANRKAIRRSGTYALVLVLLLGVDWGYWRYRVLHTPDLEITYLSVGHGDCALIEFPGGKKMLVDGGPKLSEDFDAGERIVAPYLWSRKIPKVDFIVWSHGHSDHIGGLPFIVDNFSPSMAWGPHIEVSGRTMDCFKGSLHAAGVHNNTEDGDGSRLDIGGVHVEFIRSPHVDNPDDGSLVIRLSYGKYSFLFTGDMKSRGERALLDSGRDISATVLKAPHHGGEGTISEAFLKTVHPDIAIISLGRRHGFPSPRVIKTLEKMNVRILRTDRDGAITVKTDGLRMDTVLYSRSHPTVLHSL